MIKVKIVANDISTVAKVVFIDQESKVLFLKRSDYVEKFAGDWDLPGGHLKASESLPDGLAREVKEETSLDVRDPVFLLQLDNIHFFYAMYDSQPVDLSHEHVDFKFFEKSELDPNQKFQRVAIKALEARNEISNS
tara:strand:- start:140 stop:547 length:408 start_codon:yes stop_codon:yes gene_type:complete